MCLQCAEIAPADPVNVLARDKCEEALRRLRRARWYEVSVRCVALRRTLWYELSMYCFASIRFQFIMLLILFRNKVDKR